MRWLSWMLLLLAPGAAAESFVPRALAPEQGVDIFTRSEAVRLLGRELLAEPAGSAVYGSIHLYDRFPYVESRWVAVTSDARWQRLLFGELGAAPRSFGSGGAGPEQFGEPRGLAFAPDGRLFVADRALGRLHVLRLDLSGSDPVLRYVTHVDGLAQPTDVAVHDGGTPSEPGDDRLLVVESGAHRLALFAVDDDQPTKLTEFGHSGPGTGEFLSPRAVAVGRRDGVSTDEIFVTDSGNHRLVRLVLAGSSLRWDRALDLPMEATSVDADHYGNLLLTLRRENDVWKVSPALEVLATFDGGARSLQAPRDIAVPFAWVHDHRAGATAPAWRGQGSALVLEAWRENGGVRLVDLGIEMKALRRSGNGGVEVQLTDAARVTAAVIGADGRSVRHDLGTLPAGTQVLDLPALDGAARVELAAVSLYDASRHAEQTLVLEDTAPRRLVLQQNVPNPFNPMTTISLSLPAAGQATVEVFDVKGRRVRQLFQGTLPAGPHSFTWDGRDTAGRLQSSGVYFYRVQALDEMQVRKMVMAR